MPQIGRIGDPDVGPLRADRPVDQGPVVADAVRQQGRILVLRRQESRHNRSKLRKSSVKAKRHARPGLRISRIHDGVVLQLGQPGDPRVFDAPFFFGMFVRVGQQRRHGIDSPAVHAVFAIGRRTNATRRGGLPPGKQQRRAVGQLRCPRVENGVDRVRPMLGGQEADCPDAAQKGCLASWPGRFMVHDYLRTTVCVMFRDSDTGCPLNDAGRFASSAGRG